MIKVKICGITNLEDAIASVDAGCDAIGFVFYKKTPRYITLEKVKAIIKELPKRIIKVGVFVNAEEKTIKNIAKSCSLNMLQFHGSESPEFCHRLKGYKIIKAFRVKDRIELNKILRYRTFAYLFDTFLKSKIGGTGRKFNWKLLEDIDKIKRTIFLSGGLSENNVRGAIRLIHPDWVDVSTAVEIRPGKKDHHKIYRFIKAVKKV